MLAFIGINAVVEKKFHYLTDGKAFTAAFIFSTITLSQMKVKCSEG